MKPRYRIMHIPTKTFVLRECRSESFLAKKGDLLYLEYEKRIYSGTARFLKPAQFLTLKAAKDALVSVVDEESHLKNVTEPHRELYGNILLYDIVKIG